MPEKGVRLTYSQSSFQVLLVDQNEECLSTATAFFFRASDGNDYVITNRHNVTGLDNFTGEFLSPTSHNRKPTRLTAKLSTFVATIGEDGEQQFAVLPRTIALYSGDLKTPLWREHPSLGAICDVVAIRFKKDVSIPEFMHNFANMISTAKTPVLPGNTVFIIGFPSSISVGFGLPIWKSGFIASEPFYDVTIGGTVQAVGGMSGGCRIPAFFVDSETRSGMSGSPVFGRFTGTWNMNDPYEKIDPNEVGFWKRDDVALSATAYEFLGIYSGRAPGKEGDASLGICWRSAILDEICLNENVPKHPHS